MEISCPGGNHPRCTGYQDSRYGHGGLARSMTWLYRISVPTLGGLKVPRMRIGYARVSANHQNLDRQLATLKAAGCKRIFKEKESGREGVKRPQLEKAIDTLGPGDVLVLAEWDRATRSMLDGIRIIERVAAREATLKALDRQWL